jgi:hypothetical protein
MRAPAPGATAAANVLGGAVNDRFQFARVGVGVAGLDVLHGAMKDLRPHGFLDESRKIALFHALRS